MALINVKNKITPCWVLDGSKHPMKRNTYLDQLKRRQGSENSLNAFCERGKNAPIEVSAEERLDALKRAKPCLVLAPMFSVA